MELPLAGYGEDVTDNTSKEIFRYSLKKSCQLATMLVGK